VKKIYLPPYFRGAETNFQADIALVIVTNKFELNKYMMPVAGWGLTAAHGNPSPVLRVVELPFVDVGTCYINSPADFRKFITPDKFCAGTLQFCRGDSGGGLVFADIQRATERYYLRGVASAAPRSDAACNTAAYTTFTQLSKHEHFIKQYWIES
ncbi:Pattern recognition serine proteinase, partial [Operophtera brumata]